jgi:hypothetical protein
VVCATNSSAADFAVKFELSRVALIKAGDDLQRVVESSRQKIIARERHDGSGDPGRAHVVVADAIGAPKVHAGVFKVTQVVPVPDDLQNIHFLKPDTHGRAVFQIPAGGPRATP